jgi:hypothetical protein
MRRFAMFSGLACAIALVLPACRPENGESDPLANEQLDCPAPALGEYEGWGKSGIQRICKIKHGPFVAWEAGYVHIRGQYENGKETGVWTFYGADGEIEKQIDYTLQTGAPEEGANSTDMEAR